MSTWKNLTRKAHWLARLLPIVAILLAPTVSIQAQSPSPKLNPPPDYPNLEAGSIPASLPPPAASGVIHINATAFTPQYSSTQFQYTGVALANMSAGPAVFLAPLSLPNRTQIKQVVFVYIDDNAAEDISMDLDFQPFDYVGYGHVAVAVSNGADFNIRYTAVTDFVYDPTIDNTTNTYLLTVTLPSGTSTYFISARIDYSYDSLLPAIFK